YVEWFSRAIKDIKNGSLDFASEEVIDRYFNATLERGNVSWHPPFARMLSGITWKLFKDKIGEFRAFRLSPILIFSLEVSLLYLFVRSCAGYGAGIFASLSLLLMPRVFGDAHLFALDTPIAFMCFLTAYSFFKGSDKKGWAIITGIVWGLALNTKVHAFFMPIPLFLWAIWHSHAERGNEKIYINNLIGMLVLSPLVYIVSWPWLWHDTINHIFGFSVGMGDVVVKPFNHPVYYMGRVYSRYTPTCHPPWHYPWVMILITTPPLTLLFIFAGIWKSLKQGLGVKGQGKLISNSQFLIPNFGNWKLKIGNSPLAPLFIFCAATFLILFSLPFTPKYAGVRLLSPVFPFLAGMAGVGFDYISKNYIKKRVFVFLIGGLSLLSSLISLIKIHPFELSYYNIFIGGLKGAEASGFDITYWGDPLNRDVINFIKGRLLENSGFAQIPRFGYNGGPFKKQIIFYTDIGWLPERFTQNQSHLWVYSPPPLSTLWDEYYYNTPYDYYVLYNRKSDFDEQSWLYFKKIKPIYSLTVQEIPLLNIYITPEGIKNQAKSRYHYNGLTGYYNSNQNQQSIIHDLIPCFSDTSTIFDKKQPRFINSLSIQWKGFIKILEDGEYNFAIYTDGEGSISIDDEIIVNHTGIKEDKFGYGEIFLKKGYHFIEIKYTKRGGMAYLYPLWKKTAEDKYQIIPPEVLFPEEKEQRPDFRQDIQDKTG
ncbi:MAG: glycosyltransferase family 39 protein, partial [Nitrospinae bacterium]|nr:glycosyltransferase family 39 protein [Nitrospinota bacterium]